MSAAANLAAAVAGAGLDVLLGLAGAGYPRAVLPLPAFGTVSLALWWTGLACMRRRGHARRLGIALLVSSLLLGSQSRVPAAPRLIALDVGQGDAILLQGPSGAALVDAGGYTGIDRDLGAHLVVPALRKLSVRRLDVAAVTHAHADHAGGLPSVLAAIPTAQLWVGAAPAADRRVSALLEAARRGGTTALAPRGVHTAAGCRWRPWMPAEPILTRAGGRIDNEASLVLVVECHDRATLLTGDAGTEVEPEWHPSSIAGAVLKVGHHGSDSATGDAMVRRLRPRIAVASVGARNPFGLPRDEVIARLRASGAAVYRTDRDGAVTVTLSGRRTVRGERWSSGSGSGRR